MSACGLLFGYGNNCITLLTLCYLLDDFIASSVAFSTRNKPRLSLSGASRFSAKLKRQGGGEATVSSSVVRWHTVRLIPPLSRNSYQRPNVGNVHGSLFML